MADTLVAGGSDHVRTGRIARPAATWRRQAACRGLSALMDPPEHLLTETEQDARATCRACPVRKQCFSWVLTLPEQQDPGGICAGMDPGERTRRRRQLRNGAPAK